MVGLWQLYIYTTKRKQKKNVKKKNDVVVLIEIELFEREENCKEVN
jgi:hypothetical protein